MLLWVEVGGVGVQTWFVACCYHLAHPSSPFSELPFVPACKGRGEKDGGMDGGRDSGKVGRRGRKGEGVEGYSNHLLKCTIPHTTTAVFSI